MMGQLCISHGGILIFAHTTILGLPRKEVQQRCQRLTHQTEADPKNTVSQYLPVGTFHSLQRQREINHRYLHDHSDERDA